MRPNEANRAKAAAQDATVHEIVGIIPANRTAVDRHNDRDLHAHDAAAGERAASFAYSGVDLIRIRAAKSGAELAVLRTRLGLPAREWVRAAEPEYRQAGLTSEAGDEAILAAMARFPVLIERPILILPDSAVVGRPPDRVLKLLDGEL